MIYVLFFVIFIFVMNRAMLRVRVNSENEELKRKINAKIRQSRKLDLLYGRESKNRKQEIEKAVLGVAKDNQKAE
jgi:hypothetical protein